MDFSIIICTYNGATRLPETLKHLALLDQANDIEVELLVVNNASTDDTDDVTKNAWKEFGAPFPLKLLSMPVPGKSHALGLGVQSAVGRYILICDDDNWLSLDYLNCAVNFLDNHPQAGILGGQTMPVSEVPLPSWFAGSAWAYACGQQMESEGDTTGRKPLWGAGMVLRGGMAKKIFDPPHPFLLTCRKGDELISGGDDEICYRAWLLGYRSWYLPTLRLQHFMPVNRLTIEYRDRLLAGFEQQVNVIGAYHRRFQLTQYKGAIALLFLKKIIAWLWFNLRNNKRQMHHAADTLFYITGATLWQTLHSKQVNAFCSFAISR